MKRRRAIHHVVPVGVFVVLTFAGAAGPSPAVAGEAVRIGSKAMNESVILGEIVRILAEQTGARADHLRELGGSRVCWDALLAGEIDVYPEYTGTLRQELLSGENLPDDAALEAALAGRGLRMTRPLGFENTYAIGVIDELPDPPILGRSLGVVLMVGGTLLVMLATARDRRRRRYGEPLPPWTLVLVCGLGAATVIAGLVCLLTASDFVNRYGRPDNADVRAISDLRRFPDLRAGFGNEFIERRDGWKPLRRTYGLPIDDDQVVGLEHDLAYPGLESGSIDVTDLYSTDAKIRLHGIRVLEDDLGFFPEYDAIFVYRADLGDRVPAVVDAIRTLEGRIDEGTMIAMNARVVLDHEPDGVVAADFVNRVFGTNVVVDVETRAERLLRYTRQHLFLVGLSILAAIVVAIPLGIFAAKWRVGGQVILGSVGVLQTIPSLALFVIVIPILGLGAEPAIFALFLYSLLPIVRNTYTGLADIPRGVHESAEALGLPPLVRLWRIELPMAARSILAGIKTAAVINIGTATLGGFIGAGGYGEPIFSGIRHARNDLLLEGAIPAALMALAAQGVFELAERFFVPRGLRLKPRE